MDKDYVPITEVVIFLPGELIKSIEIHIINDINVEFDENFYVYLTSGDGVHLSPFSRVEVIIRNDDSEDKCIIIAKICNISYFR